jgi:regulator of RNase E activity RraA
MPDLDALVTRLAGLDTCTVSDALDALGLPGALSGISPTWPCGRIAGRVATVRLGPASEAGAGPAPHLGARAIAGADPGDIIVVDNQAGHGYSAGWGGLLALAASLKKVSGVVVYGAARDVDDVAAVGLPMYAHSTTPRTARARAVEVSTGAPLQLENVTVEAGDLVLADRSGVVFVPRARAEDVLAKADEIFAKENEMADQLRRGLAVTDVLAGNYETMLQSK